MQICTRGDNSDTDRIGEVHREKVIARGVPIGIDDTG